MLLFAEAGLELWGEHGQSRPAAPAARSQALQGAFPVPPHLFDLPQPFLSWVADSQSVGQR